MLQTWQSTEADAAAERRLAGYPVAMPVHDTFYGMREIGVVAPGGHLIVFASPVAKPA